MSLFIPKPKSEPGSDLELALNLHHRMTACGRLGNLGRTMDWSGLEMRLQEMRLQEMRLQAPWGPCSQ